MADKEFEERDPYGKHANYKLTSDLLYSQATVGMQ
jgi:hypothetical protein